MKTISALALAASVALGSAVAIAPLAPAMAATTKSDTMKKPEAAKPAAKKTACMSVKGKKTCPAHQKVASRHHKKPLVHEVSGSKAAATTDVKKTPAKSAY